MKDKILFILQHRDKPITRHDLQESLRQSGEFDLRTWASADREVRAAIEEMIIKGICSIESSSKGYSLIKNGNQMNRSVLYDNAKIKAMVIRRNCNLNNWFAKHENKEMKKQTKFEFA